MYIQKGPYLQEPKKDSILFLWETDGISSSEVRVFKAYRPHVPAKPHPFEGDPLVFRGEPGTLHVVKAEGLAAGRDYYYQVVSEADGKSVTSNMNSFRTAPEAEGAISFILTAENGGSGGHESPHMVPMIKLIRKEHADFIQSVGDIVENGRKLLDWDTCLFSPFRKILRNTPFYPCVGNHEVLCDAVKPEKRAEYYNLYDKYFTFPRHYSYDYGCAHFTVLDCPSMVDKIASDEKDTYIPQLVEDFKNSEQYLFLEKDLKSSKAKWKFVVFHYPVHCSSWFEVTELRTVFAPLFEKYGVDIVFNSHAILYERSHPIRENQLDKNGVRYVLVGGFGGVEEWFWDKCNGLSAKVSSRPCYVRVNLTPFSLELQAIDYEGKLFDMLVLEK